MAVVRRDLMLLDSVGVDDEDAEDADELSLEEDEENGLKPPKDMVWVEVWEPFYRRGKCDQWNGVEALLRLGWGG